MSSVRMYLFKSRGHDILPPPRKSSAVRVALRRDSSVFSGRPSRRRLGCIRSSGRSAGWRFRIRVIKDRGCWLKETSHLSSIPFLSVREAVRVVSEYLQNFKRFTPWTLSFRYLRAACQHCVTLAVRATAHDVRFPLFMLVR